MSTLIKEFSLSNKCLANVLASSVLPTPVGPVNRNTPVGLEGSLRPDHDLLIDFAKISIASF